MNRQMNMNEWIKDEQGIGSNRGTVVVRFARSRYIRTYHEETEEDTQKKKTKTRKEDKGRARMP
jgi:hypothetical protein